MPNFRHNWANPASSGAGVTVQIKLKTNYLQKRQAAGSLVAAK